MKRIIGLLAMAALLFTPTVAFATGQTGIYVAPKFVYGFTQMNGMGTQGDDDPVRVGNKSDNAWGGALAIGYDFYRQNRIPVRAELEYAVFSEVSGKKSGKHIDDPGFDEAYFRMKQKLSIQTLFANAYYDFRNDTPFTPWVGAGLGMAFINSKGNATGVGLDEGVPFGPDSVSSGSKLNTNFAWNVGAGVAYAVNEAVSVDLGYRFAGLGKAKTKWGYGNDDERGRFRTKNVYQHQLMLGLRFSF